MTLREILQIELWSKRTSRKILAWCGVVIVLCGAWWAVERYWTTPGERKAGRQALVQIDALQKFESMSSSDFSLGDAKAREQIAAAQATARTRRDHAIAFVLEEYLEMTELGQQTAQIEKKIRETSPDLAAKDEESGRVSEFEATVRLQLRLGLHRALD